MIIPAHIWDAATTEERALLVASALCASLHETGRRVALAAGGDLVVEDEETARAVREVCPVRGV